jgi:acyl dehydratase
LVSRCFDDLAPGEEGQHGPYVTALDEMVEFARRWDPLPIHVDVGGAGERVHGTLIASSIYTLAIKQRLITGTPWRDAVIGAMGHDEMRFPKPVRPGDALHLRWRVVSLRASQSKPDRGIAVFAMDMLNQDDVVVLHYLDTVMLARRAAGA